MPKQPILQNKTYLYMTEFFAGMAVADIAVLPMVRNLIEFYGAGDLVGIQDFVQVRRVLANFLDRPAVQRGLAIPARE